MQLAAIFGAHGAGARLITFIRVAPHVCMHHVHHEPQTQRRTKRHLENCASGGARSNSSKASSDLAFVEALVLTGATDESEVNWTSLSPRADNRWKTLRGGRMKQSPYDNLGFQEVHNTASCELPRQRTVGAVKGD